MSKSLTSEARAKLEETAVLVEKIREVAAKIDAGAVEMVAALRAGDLVRTMEINAENTDRTKEHARLQQQAGHVLMGVKYSDPDVYEQALTTAAYVSAKTDADGLDVDDLKTQLELHATGCQDPECPISRAMNDSLSERTIN